MLKLTCSLFDRYVMRIGLCKSTHAPRLIGHAAYANVSSKIILEKEKKVTLGDVNAIIAQKDLFNRN